MKDQIGEIVEDCRAKAEYMRLSGLYRASEEWSELADKLEALGAQAPMELSDDEGWRLFLMLEGALRDGDSPDKMTQVANQWLAERSGG